MSDDSRQERLRELEKQYDDIIKQMDALSEELDSIGDYGTSEIYEDADIICTVYKKFRDAGMCENGAYCMMRDLLGF